MKRLVLPGSVAGGVIAALLLGGCLRSAKAAPSNIVQNGKPMGAIVTAIKPSRAEKFAAEEIQIYLRKMTGADVPIVAGDLPAGQAAIIIGRHPLAVSTLNLLKQHSQDQEAFAVVGLRDRLYLCANGETATLYATWSWLETLGVRWILPTERGEFVPHLVTVPLPTGSTFDAPAISYRGANFAMNPKWSPSDANLPEHGIPASYLFSYRMRLNRDVDFDPADAWTGLGSGHSYAHYLSPERYGKEHPEWYSRMNGQPNTGSGWQVAFTNPDAAAEFAKNVVTEVRVELARGHSLNRMILWVSPNDWPASDESPESQKLVESDHSATSMVTLFANRVADEVHKTYPTARIAFYAYDNYAHPPEHVQPGKNVCPELVFWTAATAVNANMAQPMFSDANSKFRQYFHQWAAMSDGISAYTYYGHYNWFTPWPQLTQIAHDLPMLAAEPKFYGMNAQDDLHWGTQAPNFYLYSRMMWNRNLDVTKTMDDYYRAGWGPAAHFVKQYFEVLQKQMDGLPYIVGYVNEIPQLLTPDVVQQCSDLMDKAAAQRQDMDAGMRWRTDLVVQAWTESAHTAEAIRLFLHPTDTAQDRRTIIQDLEEVRAFAATDTGRWAFEYPVVEPGIDGILKPLSLPLNALPVGENVYSDYLSYGGALKFWGKVDGLPQGIWGYTVPAMSKRVVELPLHAADGHSITSLTVQLGLAVTDPARVKTRVSLIGPDGNSAALASNATSACNLLTAPAHSLGATTTLRIEMDNLTAADYVELTSVGLHIKVE